LFKVFVVSNEQTKKIKKMLLNVKML